MTITVPSILVLLIILLPVLALYIWGGRKLMNFLDDKWISPWLARKTLEGTAYTDDDVAELIRRGKEPR